MSKQKKTTNELKEIYDNLIYDEIKFGIITALQWNETLNLKKIAQMIRKPETTTIRYLKQLLEDGLLDIDAEKTATSWGKFYRLSAAVNELYEEQKKESEIKERELAEELMGYRDASEEELLQVFTKSIVSKDNLDRLSIEAKQSLNFIHKIQNMIINNFSIKAEELLSLIKKHGKEYLEKNLTVKPADILLTRANIKYSSAKHIMMFLELFYKTHIEFQQLEEKIKQDMEQENVPEIEMNTFFCNLFMGSIEFEHKMKEK
jgi:DNA-binding Lrp family transcriptional regulator